MIGQADIEGSKSNVAMNAWLPQASYPCGNFSDTSSLKFIKSKGSIGHAFAVCSSTESQNQASFSPFGPQEISVLFELALGHLRCCLTDVPPQPNSQPENLFPHATCSKIGSFWKTSQYKGGSKVTLKAVVFQICRSSHLSYISQVTLQIRLESSSTGSSFPADLPKPVPLAVVSLRRNLGQLESR